MPRKVTFIVESDIPHSRSLRPFTDLLAGSWGTCREEQIGAGEPVGIGILWYTKAGEGTERSILPRPWSLVRNGLIERHAIHPKAHVYGLRTEIVHVGNSAERPRLLVTLEV